MFGSLVLVLSVVLYCVHSKKFVGKHSFVNKDVYGKDITNEFQLIHPENIRYAAKDPLTVESTYHIISSLSPTVINNDDIVTVTYETNNVNHKDWIAAYSPPSVINNITMHVPVKYGWCDEDDNYNATGIGSMTFNLTNLRDDVVFVYFTGSTYHPVFMNSSAQVVSFNNTNEPLRPRVVATGDPDVYTLLWSSATSQTPTMKWGTVSGQYTETVEAVTTTIEQSQMCGAPASTVGWRDLGLIHHANITNMLSLANLNIYYVFGDENTSDYSREYKFYVPPSAGTQPPASKNRGTRAIIFDDFGRGGLDMAYTWNHYGGPSIRTTMAITEEIDQGTVDVIYHGGDLSYADGYMAVWDFFLDQIGPMAGSVMYLTTVGNHESDTPGTASLYGNQDGSGGECGVPALGLLPQPAPAVTNEPWWSYDIGLMHMVGMSTEHNFSIGSPQYMFLYNDLMNVNRTKTPWIIFGGHRAMYVNSDYGGDDGSDVTVMENLIANIEPMLYKFKVNFAFWGHNHVMQRQAAVKNSVVVQHAEETTDTDGNTVWMHDDPQATVHIVVGTGGASFTVNDVVPYPDWNELTFYRYGYGRLESVDASTLTWQWVANNGSVMDRVTITQNYNDVPWGAGTTDTSSSAPSDQMVKKVVGTVVACLLLLLVCSIAMSRQTIATPLKLMGFHETADRIMAQRKVPLEDPHMLSQMSSNAISEDQGAEMISKRQQNVNKIDDYTGSDSPGTMMIKHSSHSHTGDNNNDNDATLNPMANV